MQSYDIMNCGDKMTAIFYRKGPMPRCKYCGVRMKYWIIGMKDKDHAHPECRGKALAKESVERAFRDFKLGV